MTETPLTTTTTTTTTTATAASTSASESARRSADLRQRLDVLLREHADVKARVTAYQRRLWLSPGETLELKTLQRLKLQKKDLIAALEGELTTLERTFELD